MPANSNKKNDLPLKGSLRSEGRLWCDMCSFFCSIHSGLSVMDLMIREGLHIHVIVSIFQLCAMTGPVYAVWHVWQMQVALTVAV